ncbi:hypothetical protein NQ317_009133 [Molorchus minor]|uniref:Uncharacterized protein n=1 Tax=Molorchus minor TaxID=1323400 RepID=A0ABQ9IRH7_9CUCU|nr:hypothetical protein NQ317_009133 [Molorchus minor]
MATKNWRFCQSTFNIVPPCVKEAILRCHWCQMPLLDDDTLAFGEDLDADQKKDSLKSKGKN